MRDFDDDVLQETFSRELSSFDGWLVGWAVGGWRGSRMCIVRGRAGGCVVASKSRAHRPEIDDGEVRR